MKKYKGNDNFQAIIYDFLKVGNEYTKRKALETLAYICPEHTEEYAIQFWNRNKYKNDEYQKMMVVHVLYIINSSKLVYYLNLAEQSRSKYLKKNAEEIRKKLRNKKL